MYTFLFNLYTNMDESIYKAHCLQIFQSRKCSFGQKHFVGIKTNMTRVSDDR